MDVCMKCLYFCLKVEGSIVGFSVQLHLLPVLAILAGSSLVRLDTQRIDIGRDHKVMLIQNLCKCKSSISCFYSSWLM
jgi:hypothetical protein